MRYPIKVSNHFKITIASSLMILWSWNLQAQNSRINLPNLVPLDDNGIHIIGFKNKPSEPLIYPSIDTTKIRFLEIFYSWDVPNNHFVTAVFLPQISGDSIFVDLNNNGDLRDDKPLYFGFDQEKIIFHLRSEADSLQKVGRMLRRTPTLSSEKHNEDSVFVASILDENGNLTLNMKMMFSSNNPDFSGEKGSFFFDEYVDIHSGWWEIGGRKVRVGLWDWNQNGLLSSENKGVHSDRLLVDFNQDGLFESRNDDEQIFFEEAFKFGNQYYKVDEIDKYGSWVEISSSSKEEFLKSQSHFGTRQEIALQSWDIKPINPAFWSTEFKDLEGNSLSMEMFRGSLTLINIWGEWCGPCIEEIPELVKYYNSSVSEDVKMIGFLKSANLDKAKEIIEERKMKWANIELSDELEKKWGIQAYPTNMFLLPDGERMAFSTGNISFESLMRFTKHALDSDKN